MGDAWELMKTIADLRRDLSGELPAFHEELRKLTFLEVSNGKLQHLIHHLKRELDEEMDLSALLNWHIAEQDAQDLHESAEGWGTDEVKMGKVILNRLPENIKLTEEVYRQNHGRTLEDVVVGENEGFITGLSHFGKFLAHRTRSQAKRDAVLFHEAMAGMGTADKVLIEMISTRTNAELKAAGNWYAEQFGETLDSRIKSETSGTFATGWYGTWMALLADFDRDESGIVPDNVEELARQLYDAGAGKWMGCDEQVFLDILAKANGPTCKAIAEAYEAMDETDNTLIGDIEKKMGGDLEYAVIARVKPRMEFLAHRLLKACEGWGTDEDCICRVLGCLTNTEVMQLASKYNELYAEKDEPLNDFKTMIASELGGDFLDGIVGMLEAFPPKSHWHQESTYRPVAAARADQFKEDVESKWADSKAITLGSIHSMDGPLELINIPEEVTFICQGFDYDIAASRGKAERPELDHAMSHTPEDEDMANDLIEKLQGQNESIKEETEQLKEKCEAAKSMHFSLVRDMRLKDNLLAQYLIDNAGMLEFCAQRDADALHEAVDGWGTDEDKLIRSLCSLNKQQLRRVDKIYQHKYEKTIRQVCDEELGGFFEGDFKYFMKCAITDPAELDAELLRESMKGWGADDTLLCEILCTRSNKELDEAKKAFRKMYGKSLKSWVHYETGSDGMYGKFLLACLDGRRAEGYCSSELAKKQAAVLRQNGLGEGDLADEPFLQILPYSSEEQIKLIKESFQEQFDADMVEAITEAMDGTFWDSALLQPLLARMDDAASYYAKALNKAMSGMGTDENTVSRVIGRSSKNDLKLISARYEELFGTPLKDAIESECGGNFQKALVTYLSSEAPSNAKFANSIDLDGFTITTKVATGFLSACWAEYVKEEEQKVGEFFEGNEEALSGAVVVLTLYEDRLRDAEDKGGFLRDLSNKWGAEIDI